jgi:hypothetical protein
MAQPEANRTEMISLLERLNGSAGIEPLFAVALLFPLAWLLAKAAAVSIPSTERLQAAMSA